MLMYFWLLIFIYNIKVTSNTNHIFFNYFSFFMIFQIILVAKYPISTALIIENPVRSPMVPPIADNMSVNFAALSFVIVLNVGVSK